MSDCRFGVSPVNYPDPDPDPDSDLFIHDLNNVSVFSIRPLYATLKNKSLQIVKS